MAIQNESVILVNPYLYKYGLVLSNNATTPNTKIDVSAGACRDSNNIVDLSIGSLFPPVNQGAAVTAPITIDASVVGVNGIDTGSLGASTMYAVYMIGDSRGINATGCILTLASNSQPLMPFGYDSLRLIGYWATDSSSHFLKGYYTVSSGMLIFKYDVLISLVSSGTATSATAVDLVSVVPPVNNCLANLKYILVADAGGARTGSVQGYNATGFNIIISAAASSTLSGYCDVDAQINVSDSHPNIKYLVSNGSASMSLLLAGFTVPV